MSLSRRAGPRVGTGGVHSLAKRGVGDLATLVYTPKLSTSLMATVSWPRRIA
jgi:hypothetical protein